ncbi:MAG: primosomal protein N' [Nitrospira sp.]|nr:primosomal protein N' [Nitrospira sp.]
MYVDVLFPINFEPFTYAVPDELRGAVKVGVRVSVPFKNGTKTGIVTALVRELPDRLRINKNGRKVVMKSVIAVLDDSPFLHEKLLKLIQWTSEYYMSTSGMALKNAVPSAFFQGKKPGKSRIKIDEESGSAPAIVLNKEQQAALNAINADEGGVFLLYGVTGSGKTEVYIEAVMALEEGQQALMLVPEIAITAQMVDRFRRRFKEDVVFFHSAMSVGERMTSWTRMRNGDARIAVGVRSAVFAPFPELTMIIVDEEQESSYKQFEGLRYNARDVALARGQLEGLKVILGSATPSLESFYNADIGKFHFIELTARVEGRPLPVIEIIDMSTADKETFSLSKKLMSELRQNVEDGNQSILMLNRRGYSPFFICAECGHSYKCPACSITLIYHKDTNTLNCHYCNSHLKTPAHCPECDAEKVKYLGTGTQRAEEDIVTLIPELSFTRMDRDTTGNKLSHYKLVKDMEQGRTDILLGTQMIAKGHDFPDVTLAAVISADIALNMPDFRSGERAFQLFTQLAGRAGRGNIPGRAYIQTYEPDHYAFEYVIDHNYRKFYDNEIQMRKELGYPPFNRLLRIIFSFRTKAQGQSIASALTGIVRKIKHRNIEILGPAPAPVEKIKSLWRWHIILKGQNAKSLREVADSIHTRLAEMKEIRIDIDVDPVNLM